MIGLNQLPEPPPPRSWCFASGRAAVLESHMLTQQALEGILDAGRIEDVLVRLGDTPLAGRFADVDELSRAGEIAREFYGALIEELRGASPSPDVVGLLLVHQALRSFKSYVKRKHMALDVAPVPSLYDDERWDEIWREQAPEPPLALRRAADAAREALAARPDRPERLDATVDGAGLSGLLDAARGVGSAFIAEYYRRYRAVKTVEVLWRARAIGGEARARDALGPGGREGELAAELEGKPEEEWPQLLAAKMDGLAPDGMAAARGLERVREFVRAADAWLMAFVREARYVAFGPERVFGCAVGLEVEGRNLALAVGGRAAGVEPGLLRRRLRASYV